MPDLSRQRWVVIGGLASVTAVSWVYILAGAGMGANPDSRAMMDMTTDWSPEYVALMLAMWWVMMVAMMLPSAAPMILLFAAVSRRSGEGENAVPPTALFAAGYLIVWGGFSLIAVSLQWGLDKLALLNPMMASASVPFGGALLIATGAYQMTPLKHACLRHCRSPIQFLGRHWQPGAAGAMRMGIEHGLYCLGCCWVLMTLLFYGGVMNLVWIAGIALYVLVEKLLPAGHKIGRLIGVVLILWGTGLLIRFLA